MTTLSLRIDKPLEVATEAGAVAVLHRLTDEAGADIRSATRVKTTVPASPNRQDVKRIDVDPGRWWVEATLPSGEVITDEVTVQKGEEAFVTLHPTEASPHEWLDWQHLVGNIEGLETYTRIAERARREPVAYARDVISEALEKTVPSNVRDMIEGTLDTVLPRGPSGSKNTDKTQDAFADSGQPTVRFCSRLAREGFNGPDAWHKIFGATAPTSEPQAFREAPAEGIYLYRFASPGRANARAFANIEWAGERYAVSLPVPWPLVGQTKDAEVELMVRMHPADKTVQASIAVLDSEFGTLAGLMTASTLPKARIFVDQAYDMLMRNVTNRLAAAAGGYVLVASGGSDAHPDWQQSIDNLANSFDFPDGPVLKATRYLRYPQGKGCYDVAKAALFEGFERGIPYYSAGVAWLLDGLTSFADEDAEANKRMKLVHKVAQRLDVSQAFTVIRVSDRVRPK